LRTRTQHGNSKRPADAPRAGNPAAPAEVLQLQRSAGNVAVARALGGKRGGVRSLAQVSLQRESADLLQELAEPKIGKPQAKEVQIKLIQGLDDLFKSTSEFNLGGILINELPDSDEDLLNQAQLVRLPHGTYKEGEQVKSVTEFKSTGEDRAKEVIEAGLGPLVVENTLKTMIDARQIEYLRQAKLPNDQWKILVEVHYISARPKDMSGFHKDTRNETLFVNLNYHVGEREVVGPEYVVNPTPPQEHEQKIASTLPGQFMADLKTARTKLGEPSEIKYGIVGPYGYVAFVDEAIHHTTPHYGQRVVSGEEVESYMETKHAEFKEIKRADTEYRSSKYPDWMYKFPTYVNKKILKEEDIPTWQPWLELTRDSKALYTREDLVDKKKLMTTEEYEEMLATVGSKSGSERKGGRAGGFERVLVNSGTVPVDPTGTRPRLKRRMSESDLKRPQQLPETVTRRFLRTWVRAIPKEKAERLQALL
jgi:hypothetical protein